nr:probable methyltransferase PMT24 [Tanacetum cinerariifolium]GEZ50960.1 probable methyltransferase PMT24 [Tanacetum cinerariifolium]
MRWERVVYYKDRLSQFGASVFTKLTSIKYENGQGNDPPLCENNDDPYAIWNNVVTEVESGDNIGGGITNACDRA